MERRNKKTKGDMTPMIDCVFLLLIFFVIAAKFIAPEGMLEVWMPKDSGGVLTTPAAEISKDVRIRVTGGQDDELSENSKNIKLYLDQEFYGEFDYKFVEYKKTHPEKYQRELNKIRQAFRGDQGVGQRLAKLQQIGANPHVVIDADPNIPYLFIVESIDVSAIAHIKDVKFAGAKKRLSKISSVIR